MDTTLYWGLALLFGSLITYFIVEEIQIRRNAEKATVAPERTPAEIIAERKETFFFPILVRSLMKESSWAWEEFSKRKRAGQPITEELRHQIQQDMAKADAKAREILGMPETRDHRPRLRMNGNEYESEEYAEMIGV